MILFKEDWAKFPTAVVQGNTKNKTWLKARETYIKLGVENCDWHLQLLDPGLLNVDPHTPMLPPDILARILLECYRNPTYLFREVLRVKIKGSNLTDFISADRGVLATLWLYLNNVDTTNTQLRQTGKTFKGYLIFIWLIIFRLNNSTVLWSTTTDSKRRDTIKEIRSVMECIPPQLYKPHKFDSKNYEIITNKDKGNVGIFSLAQKDKNAAETNYLGFSVANALWDEIAEASNSHISLAAATGAMNAAREQAMKAGSPYGSIYLCTAPNLLKKEGQNFYKLSRSGPQWTEAFLDCLNKKDLIETIAANGGDMDTPLVDVTMSWRQLGKTPDEFRLIVKKTIANSGGDKDIVKRHCYSIPTFGSKDKPVTPAQAEVLMANIQSNWHVDITPEKAHIRYYSGMDIVRKVNDLGRLLISIDTSTASGRDTCSITFMDASTMLVLARCDISRLFLGAFEAMVARLLTQYDKSVFVIEAKSTGNNLIDALVMKCYALRIDPFARIFNRIYQYREKNAKKYDEIRSMPISRRTLEWYARYKEYFGFSTNAQLRKEIYDQCLVEAVERAGNKMRCRTLITQLVGLESDKNGRVDHVVGEHDDAAFSFLLGVWFVLYGRNFGLYGIKPRDVLAAAPRGTDGEVTKEDLRKREVTVQLEGRAELLAEKINAAKGSPVAKKYIELIERINAELERNGSEVRNLDTLLESLNSRR